MEILIAFIVIWIALILDLVIRVRLFRSNGKQLKKPGTDKGNALQKQDNIEMD